MCMWARRGVTSDEYAALPRESIRGGRGGILAHGAFGANPALGECQQSISKRKYRAGTPCQQSLVAEIFGRRDLG